MSRRDRIRAKIMERVEVAPAPEHMPAELGPCHLWTGPTSGSGRGGDYPRMSLDGQTVAVHIVSWTNENGFIPGKKQLDHLCRRRRCVSDLHLELVTHKQNQKRRAKAQRDMRGHNSGFACDEVQLISRRAEDEVSEYDPLAIRTRSEDRVGSVDEQAHGQPAGPCAGASDPPGREPGAAPVRGPGPHPEALV